MRVRTVSALRSRSVRAERCIRALVTIIPVRVGEELITGRIKPAIIVIGRCRVMARTDGPLARRADALYASMVYSLCDVGGTLCAAAVFFLLGRIERWSGREVARSALSLARSAQAERDNESCLFVRAAGLH
ncbi:hypothetical protein EVAR_96733_1 [Eumeta japonica]|uniref:Uncharacterized protein n=1 Tax=Eumeta variegata TaxID=151549 RepID=A0A4C1Y3U2_EUMVA|nr:hypothetical protein EVAR_96733_1 [Eumeta japonica]